MSERFVILGEDDDMNNITSVYNEFVKLCDTQYVCTISKNRNIINFIITFQESDFCHIAGLQHMTDIDVIKDKKKMLTLVKEDRLPDELLSKSIWYRYKEDEECSNIQDRINEIKNLESYLDANKIIKIYIVKYNPKSKIVADYVMQCNSPKKKPMYIFLRKREKSDTYCVVSYFRKKNIEYRGETVYWMKRVKKCKGTEILLYKNKHYNP